MLPKKNNSIKDRSKAFERTYRILLLRDSLATEALASLVLARASLHLLSHLLFRHLGDRLDRGLAREAQVAEDRQIVAIVLVPSFDTAVHIWVQVGSVALYVLSHLLLLLLLVILLVHPIAAVVEQLGILLVQLQVEGPLVALARVDCI